MPQFERKHNRLQDYDYGSNGIYFLTICVQDRKCVLCEKDPTMKTVLGEMVDRLIQETVVGCAGFKLLNWVVMPNHVHILIAITDSEKAASISMFVRYFKRVCTVRIGYSLWQRSFYDHVIRDAQDMAVRWKYIENNPARWEKDKLYCPTTIA